ncbi:MAG: M67 family metallopeptidase [Synechococcus sp.]
MLVERIGQPAQTPWSLVVDSELLIILRSTLQAALPEEGCALLLGQRQPSGWCLQHIWPCCNVWHPGIAALPEAAESSADTALRPSRRQRFALDPREQLLAQRWARQRGLAVIGTAHSHPQGDAVPSRCDRDWLRSPALMLIQGADLRLRAWWLEPEPAPDMALVHDTVGSDHPSRSA